MQRSRVSPRSALQLAALAAITLAATVSIHPLRARASPPFELVGSALGSGGLSARASGADASSSYFNPARLAFADQGVELGWFVLNDAIDLSLFARSPSVDVPELALGQFGAGLPPLPTSWLDQGCDPANNGRCVTKLAARPRQSAGSSGETRVYQVIGLVSKIVERYLTLGVYGMIPIGTFLTGNSFFVDEREQYFSNSLHPELYSDRLTAMSLAFGLGSQLTDWLSIGVGVTLSLTNTADAGTYVGNSARIAETLQLATKIEVSTGVAPNFGVVLKPVDGLDVSLAVHTPQKMEVNTGFSTFLPNGDLQRADRDATLAWEPWTFGLGAHYDFYRGTTQRFGVVVSTTYRVWSDYLNRQNERPLQGYAWSDTFAFAVGLRHNFEERLSSFVDVSYTPTPVPEQTGRTNYVDNDSYTVGGGVTYEFPIATHLKLRLGLQGQVHRLPERSQTKLDPRAPEFGGKRYSQLVVDEWADGSLDRRGEVLPQAAGLQTNNPGWPGFSSQGVLWAGGLNAALKY